MRSTPTLGALAMGVLALTAFAVMATPASASSGVVFTDDFETAPTTGHGASGTWSSAGIYTVPTSGCDPTSVMCGTRMRGAFSTGTATLTVSDLPDHDQICVSFDLLAARSVDGVTSYGPDRWSFLVDGATVYETTLTTSATAPTNYPHPYLGPTVSGARGYLEYSTLEVGGSWSSLNAMWRFPPPATNWQGNPITDVPVPFWCFAHSDPSVAIGFRGTNWQGVSDEFWAIDNVEVQAFNAGAPLPELGTLVLFGAAAAILGTVAVARRR